MKITGDNFEFILNTGRAQIDLDKKFSIGFSIPDEALSKANKVINKADDVVQILKDIVGSIDRNKDENFS